MATYSIVGQSSSANGLGTLITATSSPGTVVHIAVAGETAWDEVYLSLVNISAYKYPATVQWGGTDAAHGVPFTVLGQDGPKCVIPGWRIRNGLYIRVYAAAANVIVAYCTISRRTP